MYKLLARIAPLSSCTLAAQTVRSRSGGGYEGCTHGRRAGTRGGHKFQRPESETSTGTGGIRTAVASSRKPAASRVARTLTSSSRYQPATRASVLVLLNFDPVPANHGPAVILFDKLAGVLHGLKIVD